MLEELYTELHMLLDKRWTGAIFLNVILNRTCIKGHMYCVLTVCIAETVVCIAVLVNCYKAIEEEANLRGLQL